MKKISRFIVLMLAAFFFQVNITNAFSAGWQQKFKEITLGVITGENESDRTARYAPVKEYLEKKLGVKVNWRAATDYAGIIEGVKSDKIQLAYFGPASYVECWIVTKGKVRPILGSLDLKGDLGYYSVIIVKKDSPYKKVQDLKGKKMGWADPNSTSGYQAPYYYMSKEMLLDPDKFFSAAVFSGSHENSVIGLLNGTFDAVATSYVSETSNNPLRMEEKKMIEPGQWRIIWKSPKLPASPWAVPTWLPADMQTDIENAMMKLKDENPAAWKNLTDGKVSGYAKVTNKDYEDILKIIEFNKKNRKDKK